MVIEIQHISEITENSYIGYVCEPNVEAAAMQFEARTGTKPEKVYRRIEKSGKSSVYIPWSSAEIRC